MNIRSCVRCGSTERYVSGGCAPCHRAYSARHRAANPDDGIARKAAWRAANPDKTRASDKACRAAWRAANPEKHLDLRRRYWHKTRARHVEHDFLRQASELMEQFT